MTKRGRARLRSAVRAHCSRLHIYAAGSAARRAPMHPRLVSGEDMADWRSHLSTTERELVEAAIEAGEFDPKEWPDGQG